jgi:hypothetical protein
MCLLSGALSPPSLTCSKKMFSFFGFILNYLFIFRGLIELLRPSVLGCSSFMYGSFFVSSINS